ncbi:phenylacetate--CoA ligase family protein [Desulfoferrobacter suflitae]|uniref:phenylacetate--CoA ligase family protein n=1 Tax=Desulfoferrobacter suflitae TaxID=2865782 RepID=UPI002164166E|nr:hypothetical protein [Desulfoferrobacter suflitae]MCK8603938.1 hypothetical protein [Desulfoferrobacter suflitae]
MENKVSRAFYDCSPALFRNIAASGFGVAKNYRRYRGMFRVWLNFFKAAQGWTEEQLHEFQNLQLREMVRKAFQEVPYYQDRFAKLGITAADIRSVQDLAKLPLLEKSDVIEAGTDLISRAWPIRKLRWYPTSGSTGTPLQVPRPYYIEQMEWAFLHARFYPSDVINSPYSSFTGLELIPPNQSKPPFWVDNWMNRQRMYSIFHMSTRNLPYYIKSLDSRYSHLYIGYPSAMYTIAKFMQERSFYLHRPPHYILTSSEELQPHYEDALLDAFGSNIRNRYGQNEFVGSITMYDCGHLHYDMDYSILEFLPVGHEDGAILAEVVGTNMHDTAWPLIRYRTGDLVVYNPDDHCAAGYPGQVIRRIHGRTGRYFELPDGSRITNISVIAKKCTNVKLMQVVQQEIGSILVRVVRAPGYSSKDEMNIFQQFRRKIGNSTNIDLEYVTDIERTTSGKFISIINEVAK